MNPVRGVILLVAAALAFYKGWKIHIGGSAWLAYGLGMLALGLALWRMTRKADRPRV